MKVEEPRGIDFFEWGDQHLADAGRQLHLLQVQAADTLLGEMLDRLKQIGAYKDSMIVVTADHGVAFSLDQPTRAVTPQNYPQIMWPPLFIKYPDESSARVDDRPAQSVDIVPTIADVVGAKIDYPIDGRSLLGAPRPEGPRPMYQWGAGELAGALAGAKYAPPGSHLDFDGATGFKQVLAARAAPPGGDPTLRIYRATGGEYGALLGTSVAPIVRDEPGRLTVSIAKIRNLSNVDPTAHDIPWAYHEGFVNGIAVPASLAIGLDGKIVALAQTAKIFASTALFTFLLPPQLVHRGRNDLRVYLISGPPSAPKLDPLPVKN